MRILPLLFIAPFLSGCIVGTAADIVTAPVRAGAQVADWTTTRQDEADRNLGRRMREREAEIGRLARERDRAARRCADGRASACADRDRLDEEIAVARESALR